MGEGIPSRGARAVVTGAGSGIGRAFALELAARGGRVVCADLDLSAAESTVAAIRRGGYGEGHAVRCDVSSLGEVEALASTSRAYFGEVPTLLVNNAGIGVGGQNLEDISMEDWRFIVGVNLFGVIHGCRTFVPLFREARRGAVINVASAASFGSAPQMGAYNVTKAGVVSLSETLHAELAGTGVRVAVLCPTFVKTNILRNARLPGAHEARAQQLMDRQGTPPDVLVRGALDGLDRGEIHLLPQLDARISWWAKRFSPGTFTRGMGWVGKMLPRAPRTANREGA